MNPYFRKLGDIISQSVQYFSRPALAYGTYSSGADTAGIALFSNVVAIKPVIGRGQFLHLGSIASTVTYHYQLPYLVWCTQGVRYCRRK